MSLVKFVVSGFKIAKKSVFWLIRHFMGYNFTKQTYSRKVYLGEVYIQKEQENFKKHSSSNTIGEPLHMSHPVTVNSTTDSNHSHGNCKRR